MIYVPEMINTLARLADPASGFPSDARGHAARLLAALSRPGSGRVRPVHKPEPPSPDVQRMAKKLVDLLTAPAPAPGSGLGAGQRGGPMAPRPR